MALAMDFILGFSAGTGHRGLFLSTPRNQIMSKEHNKTPRLIFYHENNPPN
jgi:hypothetical protein